MRVREFQDLMRDLYIRNDRKRGLEKTFIWLVEEVGEVARALNSKRDGAIDNVGEELADVIAWTCSVANILGLDLESELAAKYPGKCPKCGKNPCVCETA
ncbi:MAG: MazG nucleotide pyrophosphohydrolase domain-containing protein [Promethearchaeota archaeon]